MNNVKGFPKSFLVLALCLGASLMLAHSSWSKDAKDIVAEAQTIQSATKPFKIELSTAEGKTTYAAGEKINFVFKTDRDCYLTLIDIGTSGKVTQLFPNKWHESNKVEKGKEYRVPPADSGFLFKVEGQNGTEFVKAIATLAPMTSVQKAEMKGSGNFAEIVQPEAVLKDIKTELDAQDPKSWTEAHVSFTITGGQPSPAASTADKPFTLQLKTDKTEYKQGEPIVFTVESNKECYLTLIDIGTSGKVKIIFPNQYRQDNVIPANKPYRIPMEGVDVAFSYKVEGPPGKNTVKAIGTLNPCKFFAQPLPFKDFVYPLLGDKDQVLKDIAVALNSLQAGYFAEAEATIEIK
uniref:DUF4384 domain-containing protein n=1 Tax=Desulfomonile tiedjei TaxID=2358 RepID=A0A7C4AR99_9BACT